MKTKLLVLFLSTSLFFVNLIATAQQTWIQKANCSPVGRTDAFGFSIGTKGYIGAGESATGFTSVSYIDFWEWEGDTASALYNTWTQKANFAGGQRQLAASFSIGTKGYVGTGYSQLSSASKDFYEWDQASNRWARKADFAGTGKRNAVGFSIGTKGYIGTGTDQGAFMPYSDFYEYDPATDKWTQKADIPLARSSAAGFSIGNKGYICTGTNYYSKLSDLWEWNQASNKWTQKADLPGPARIFAVGFSIGNQGFIGTGVDKNGISMSDFWQWDQATNTWTKRPDYPGGAVHSAVGFSIGKRGYIGTGTANLNKSDPNNGFWEYSDTSIVIPPPPCFITISAYADPASICQGNTIAIYASGATNYSWNTGETANHITVSPNVTTTYNVDGTNTSGCTGSTSITITVKDCTTGIDEINSSLSVLVSPNPFNESATVIITGAESAQSHEMKIYDVLGNEVRSLNFIGKQITFERENLADGVYFYHLTFTPSPAGEGRGEVSGKFVISK